MSHRDWTFYQRYFLVPSSRDRGPFTCAPADILTQSEWRPFPYVTWQSFWFACRSREGEKKLVSSLGLACSTLRVYLVAYFYRSVLIRYHLSSAWSLTWCSYLEIGILVVVLIILATAYWSSGSHARRVTSTCVLFGPSRKPPKYVLLSLFCRWEKIKSSGHTARMRSGQGLSPGLDCAKVTLFSMPCRLPWDTLCFLYLLWHFSLCPTIVCGDGHTLQFGFALFFRF